APVRIVPYRKRKHPVETIDAAFAPADVGVKQNLRVGRRGEFMPLGLEPRSDLRVVVDFTVEHNPRLAVGHAHRLKPTVREIENREAPVAESDADHRIAGATLGAPLKRIMQLVPATRREQESFTVWTSVHEQIAHPLQIGRIYGTIRRDDAD